jgi:DNA-binding CsgD family transcriptional regulator
VKSRALRNALRDATLAIDRARARRKRDPEAAIDLWRALVEGRWSMIDRFDSNGRRLFVARRNDPAARGPRGLTARERQVVGYAALGHSNKLIAYELGLAESTVANHLTDAQLKLGVRTRTELIQIHSAAVPRRS